MHVMIDLETMGTSPDASIVQVAAVAFTPRSGGRVMDAQAFNAYVHMETQASMVSHDTIAWWLVQSEAARTRLAEGMARASSMPDVLDALTAWPRDHLKIGGWESVGGVWAHPATFDLPILKTAYVRSGRPAPWDRRREFDTRTAYLLLTKGTPPKVAEVGTAHDAVDDCIYQICQLQSALGDQL